MLQSGNFDVQGEDFTVADISVSQIGSAAAAADALTPGVKISQAAIIGNFPPRQCGLATFTRDMYSCLAHALPQASWHVIAMNDADASYDYPAEVTDQLPQNDMKAYRDLADRLNADGTQVLFVQHEFGIYGGPAGAYLLECLERLKMPVVTTLHTVLESPNSEQRRVMDRLIRVSATVVTMARKGAEILRRVYNVPESKIAIVPHGAPSRPLKDTSEFKAMLNLTGKKVLTTFGLLSPNKGIDTIIAALPQIVRAHPDTMYLIVGATHPHLIKNEGEAYRDRLTEMARKLGVENHIRFVNRFINDNDLVDILQATDVYVTPYLTETQITSGTLSYALALGKPVVSTPYWHAAEALAGGVGALCPFNDSDAFTLAINNLLSSDKARQSMAMRAYMYGLSSRWSAVAQAYVNRAETDILQGAPEARATVPSAGRAPLTTQSLTYMTAARRALEAEPTWQAIERMTDGCGIIQHGKYRLQDRNHGYCADDNCRALTLVTRQIEAETEADQSRKIELAYNYASFVNHAWNDDAGRFRNFMSYGRDWLDDGGSDDCCARCFEALVDTARSDLPSDLKNWATQLGSTMLSRTGRWTSVRSRAVLIRALSRAHGVMGSTRDVNDMMQSLSSALHARYKASATKDHLWFEPKPTYDNARLSEGLIIGGYFLGDREMMAHGVESLEWLMRQQSDPDSGHFVPVPTSQFKEDGPTDPLFDQQPLEVLASIEACMTAARLTGDALWKDEALRAFAWFHGGNTLELTMISNDGGCFDGLTCTGVNENQGAESILAYHQSWSALKNGLDL
jgi:glycosyltransferase involved in cell wall biosynthesis